MKLKEYVNELRVFASNHPELSDHEVYYATDEEGNDYKPVIYSPSEMKETEGLKRGVCVN